jgi:hypothetical protein
MREIISIHLGQFGI